ncbi:putative bifunctional diguanylate cyclase/phosphodiesterase [Kineococcus sp. LSe6-4]|uniref:Bifunctional diguanylate cyclase/phosphodiesterase n=1 Tax=Kineococcus halophytocola TaxID=3234027 RepID=A0ABV4H4M9_9ACTN
MRQDESPPEPGTQGFDVASAVLPSRTGLVVCDLRGLVLQAGDAIAADLWASCEADLVGRTLGELLSSPEAAGEPLPLDRCVEELRAGAEDVRTGTLVRRPDGEVVRRTVLLTLATAPEGGPVVLVQQLDPGEDPAGAGAGAGAGAVVGAGWRCGGVVRPAPGRDALTGLPDRAGALADLDERLRARGGVLGVIACDLDRFRVVNDSLGHDAGDRVLTTVASRLALGVRGHDLLARLGDDEFLVVLTDLADQAEAVDIAHRLTRCVGGPFVVDTPAGPQEIRCTASTGLVVVDLSTPTASPTANPTAGAVLRDATTALAAAKAAGGGSCHVVTQALRERAAHRLTVENDLRRAVEEGELRVHYQPVVDLRDGRRTGFEALVRWAHPRRGLLLPEQFLDVARDCGLLAAVDGLVLEEALGFLARHPGVHVAVNTSARRLDGTFAATVARGLRCRGLSPDRLTVELLEDAIVPGDPVTESELCALATLGVGVLIDDFGTGYSALSYLRRLPVTGLKLDRSFVADLPQDAGSDRIAAAVAGLAGGFGLTSTCEGVETAAQARHLAAQGWQSAQGFHFGVPAPEERWFPLSSGSC